MFARLVMKNTQVPGMLVKKEQNSKISDLYIKIRVYTSRFIFINQDSYLYIKIHMYTSGFAYMHQDPYI